MVYLFVGIGGAIGSILRYLISYVSLPVWNGFPGGTVIINLLGAFILGWFASRVAPLENINPAVKTGLSTGIIGSFTTFSTLSLETIQLMEEAKWGWFIIYVLISIFGGLILTAAGYFFGKRNQIEVTQS
jgi:fluoride exporter